MAEIQRRLSIASDESRDVLSVKRSQYQAFEQATGVDVIIDDTLNSLPGLHNPVRREVAQMLERLIEDGRITRRGLKSR